MSEEELDAAGALAVDEDQDEVLEDLSLEERKERLKKARWNVFLYLGVAAILFGFALFPMPFSADYDSFTKSSEKDIGFVWGLPVDGPDLFDVPLHLTVAATAPPKQTTISIAVYVIEEDDCTDPSMGEKMREAKTSDSHAYQYQVADEPVFEETDYEFEFNIDPGHYCLITEYIHGNGTKIEDDGMELSVDGKLYPNQFFAGVAGLACLSLSAFAFLGAQRHGGAMRKLLEGENESTESKVLSEASRARIAAGPGGGPPQAGPSGPPPSEGPSEPPAETAPAEPPAEASEPTEAPPAAATPAASQPEGTFEPAENGYFFRKMPDGTYDQTVYVQNEDGSYVPHEG